MTGRHEDHEAMGASSGYSAVVKVGSRLVFDGGLWEVAELDAPAVVLRDSAGSVRRVGLRHLLADAFTRLLDVEDPGPAWDVGADISNLTKQAQVEFAERIGHIQELRCGFRRGHAELALPGEPRPQFRPDVPVAARCAAKAAEMGIGVSTVRRWLAGFRDQGPAALLDGRWSVRADPLSGADSRWLEVAGRVLAEYTDRARPTRDLLLAVIAARVEAEHADSEPPVRVPSARRGRALLAEISRGTSAFGGTKAKRSIASRPPAPYGRLRATRPGEFLLLDTTRLDVFAMDPVTLRWVNCELTIGMDLYDRCITGLRLTPVSTKAVDAAGVLFESVSPHPAPAPGGFLSGTGLYHGVPRAVVVDADKLADEHGNPLLPSVAPETVVVDNGRIYLSEQLISAITRLGATLQPARPYQATDKAALERFFRTLSEQLLSTLPGYKGPDVHSRGLDPEGEAFYFLDELERIIRRWLAECYHRAAHAGLTVPEVPGLELSPLQMYAHGVNRAGWVQVPARSDLVFDFLAVMWRTIQHYGVEIGGLRYDGAALNPYRKTTSPFTGTHEGKWPIRIDPGDVSRVYFQDPKTNLWHALVWEHAAAIGGPFSAEALAYARHLAQAKHRFPDVKRALAELLRDWGAGLANTPTERRMALRASAERLRLVPDEAALIDEPSIAPSRFATAVTSTGAGCAADIGNVGDDDFEEELDAAFPGADVDAGDFYAEAMEIA